MMMIQQQQKQQKQLTILNRSKSCTPILQRQQPQLLSLSMFCKMGALLSLSFLALLLPTTTTAFVIVVDSTATTTTTSIKYSRGSSSSSSSSGNDLTTTTSGGWKESTLLKGTESEIAFDSTLDGSQMRIGIVKARWNTEHVENLIFGIKKGLSDCNVDESNIFETSVPGSFELPIAARFLALSGTVDVIICVGVLIKGETMHFEYISDAVAKGIMNIGIQTSTPVIFGVLTALNAKQVIERSTGDNNHGYDWGKTAVEMALLRTEAMGGKAADTPLKELGFGLTKDKSSSTSKKELEKVKPGFF